MSVIYLSKQVTFRTVYRSEHQ